MFSGYRFLAFEHAGGVLTVFLDKPPANSLDESLYEELVRMADEVDADHATRALVFTSRHPKMFIAGADIKEMQDYRFEKEFVERKISLVHATLNRLEDITRPTVAAITGHALGGGCEFALCMDFRMMSRGGPKIGLPEINLGIIPGGGGTLRVPRVLGYARAADLMMTGRHLDADEAERIGLITRACAPERTIAEAQEFASRLAGQPPVAIRELKRCLRESWGRERDKALAIEKDHCRNAVLSADAREGIAAFCEKRGPKWTGR